MDPTSVLRAIRQRPLAAVLVLMLGGSAAVASAVFTIADAVLFSPLPYRGAESIVRLAAPYSFFLSRPDLAEQTRRVSFHSPLLTEQARAHGVWVVQPGGNTALSWPLRAVTVSPNMFSLLGVEAFKGRLFVEADVGARPRRILISHQLWRDRFGEDPDVVGSVITIPETLDDQPWLLLGVLPSWFGFPERATAWVPLAPEDDRRAFVPDFARLGPGVTIEAVRRALPGVEVTPLATYLEPSKAGALVVLVSVTSLLLLIAWTHTAALVMSRAQAQSHETAIRLALGATPAHIRRRLKTEAWLMSLAVTVVGFGGAIVLTPLLASQLPVEIASGSTPAPGWRTAAALLVLMTTAASWWARLAAQAQRGANAVRVLTGSPRRDTGTSLTRRRQALLIVQVSVATAMAYAAFIAVESYASLSSRDLGFRPDGLLAIPLPLPPRTRDGPIGQSAERHNQYLLDFTAEVLRLPGVRDGAFTTMWPLMPLAEPVPMRVGEDGVLTIEAKRLAVSRGYPRVVGAEIREGREATEDETRVGPTTQPRMQPALVNETLARAIRPHGPVLGTVLWPSPVLGFRIVGVVGDIRQGMIEGPGDPIVYPYLHARAASLVFLVRTDASAVSGIRRALLPGMASGALVDLAAVAREATAPSRAYGFLLGTVALASVGLLALGVSAAVATVVTERRHAIAVRLAIGATYWQAIRPDVRAPLLTLLIGVPVGLAVGSVLVRTAGAIVQDVRVFDLSSVALTAITVWVAGIMATVVPAHRVALVSPVSVLKGFHH